MWAILSCLALVTGQSGPALSPEDVSSYLIVQGGGPDSSCMSMAVPYFPQEGDLLLWSDRSVVTKLAFLCVGSRLPNHASIVVLRDDGTPAVLDACFNTHLRSIVGLHDVFKRLRPFKGTVYVRRLRCPLSPEQSAMLTQFASCQQDKGFAFEHLPVDAFCARAPFGNQLLGRTELNRSRWTCSELVVAAGTVAGLFDPNIHHANAILPADLLDDRAYDLSCTWMPASRWSPVPCTCR